MVIVLEPFNILKTIIVGMVRIVEIYIILKDEEEDTMVVIDSFLKSVNVRIIFYNYQVEN